MSLSPAIFSCFLYFLYHFIYFLQLMNILITVLKWIKIYTWSLFRCARVNTKHFGKYSNWFTTLDRSCGTQCALLLSYAWLAAGQHGSSESSCLARCSTTSSWQVRMEKWKCVRLLNYGCFQKGLLRNE